MAVKKIIGGTLILILLVNFVLFFIGRIKPLTFWVIIILGAVASWMLKKMD